MTRTPKTSERGVYKLEANGRIYYRWGNNADDAKERLFREYERLLGSSVLVPEIKIVPRDKQ